MPKKTDIKAHMDNPITQSLKEFLAAESLKQRMIKYCPKCGSVMAYRFATFSLAQSDEAWDVPLPFCPECISEEAA